MVHAAHHTHGLFRENGVYAGHVLYGNLFVLRHGPYRYWCCLFRSILMTDRGGREDLTNVTEAFSVIVSTMN